MLRCDDRRSLMTGSGSCCGSNPAAQEKIAGEMQIKNKTETMTDEELIRRLRQGDTQIADCLLNKYKNLVRSKARVMYLVGGDSDDLIQEGMIGLYKAIRDYDPSREASFASFAELCVSRQLYTAVQASLRKKHLPLNTYVPLDVPDGSGTKAEAKAEAWLLGLAGMEGQNPEELVLAREKVDAIRAEISKCLSKYEREVLSMYLDGMNYSQIAATLKKEPKSVDNALQRIKNKLKNRL